jgi:hypothetical protein
MARIVQSPAHGLQKSAACDVHFAGVLLRDVDVRPVHQHALVSPRVRRVDARNQVRAVSDLDCLCASDRRLRLRRYHLRWLVLERRVKAESLWGSVRHEISIYGHVVLFTLDFK